MLLADPAEPVAQLKDEVSQAFDQARLELAFQYRLAKAKELEVVAALQRFFRLLGQMLWQGRREIVRLALCSRALVGLAFNLVEEHGAAPAEAGAAFEVVQPCSGVCDLHQHVHMVAPRNVDDEVSHSLCEFFRRSRGDQVSVLRRAEFSHKLCEKVRRRV